MIFLTTDKPRPVPFPGVLVVKKGSKISELIFRDSRPGVANFHDDGFVSRPEASRLAIAGIRFGVIGFENSLKRMDRQRAARGHGVASVDEDIDNTCSILDASSRQDGRSSPDG